VTEDNSKKALARLSATGRKCDHCGTHIGRWTDKCHYDPVFDRAYCSTNGCAVKFSRSPFCAGCGCQVNPFETKGVTRLPGAGGEITYCAACSVDDSLDEEPPTVPAKKAKRSRGTDGIVIPAPLVVLSSEPPTESEMRDAEAGPYRVVETRPGWYQVRFRNQVRSTGPDKNRLTKLCARFNAQ